MTWPTTSRFDRHDFLSAPLNRHRHQRPAARHRGASPSHVALLPPRNALGARCRALGGRDDAAHRIEAGVEAADVSEESSEHADSGVALRNLPDAEDPDDEQTDFGQQRDRRCKQRPGLVQLVVHLQVVLVGSAETLAFALFLGKGLDDADAGDGVGQHVGYFGPDAVDLLEAGAQLFAHEMDEPADDRQRQQCNQGQPRVDAEQDDGGHRDHQHVGGKVEQVERQENVDAVGFVADARHEVAGALAAEIFEREAEQVIVGLRAQVAAHAFGNERQDVGADPAEHPGQRRGAEEATEVHADQRPVDRFAILEGDQHLVHERHRQIGRDQGCCGRRQREGKSQDQLPAIGAGKAPKAE